MLTISLRPITKENWLECVHLSVTNTQMGFVASNMFSIAEWKFEPEWSAYGIYNEAEMVGFIMFGFEKPKNRWTLHRLMIDKKYQHKGIGKQAVIQAIELMKTRHECISIFVGVRPSNVKAENLFLSLGFNRTDFEEDDQIIYQLDLV